MTWFEDADNQTASTAAHVEVVNFVKVEFPSATLRLHSRIGDLTWDGETWTGVGQLGSISDLSEDAILRPSGVTLKLSGVDSVVVNAAVEDDYHGYPVSVYQGFFDTDDMTLVADPQLVFRGLIDRVEVALAQNTGEVAVHCEGELARWDRHQGLLYTAESQKTLYPDDKGFDNLVRIQNRTIEWVKKDGWGLRVIARKLAGSVRI